MIFFLLHKYCDHRGIALYSVCYCRTSVSRCYYYCDQYFKIALNHELLVIPGSFHNQMTIKKIFCLCYSLQNILSNQFLLILASLQTWIVLRWRHKYWSSVPPTGLMPWTLPYAEQDALTERSALVFPMRQPVSGQS